VPDRSNAQGDKRRLLLDAAVRVFARKGYHAARVGDIAASFAAIQEIVERGQADGSLRADLDARLASYVFYGAIEELLTGWVLGRLPDSDDDLARAERTVVEIVTGGLATAHAGARA
jgi:TetR/AcrR family transcriptional regulator, fatty acid metabolism regulator protein